jgi:PAS domain S-box-containing protein
MHYQKYNIYELEYLAAIIDSTDDAIISKNLNSVITSWNLGAERMFGYKRDEVIGKSILILIPDDLLQEEGYILSKIMKGEKVEHYETTRVGKNEKEIKVSLTISPIIDDTGVVIGASQIARDITQIREAEAKQAMLAAIIESSEDAIVSKDLNGIVTSWNPAAQRLFGYKPEEMIGQPIYKLFPEDRMDEEPRILERIRKGERVEHFDTVRRSKDGKLLDISLTISPIKDKTGKITGASKIARDISDRKRQEKLLKDKTEELERSNRELNDFAYIISHDLKAPLRAIGSLASFLQMDYSDKLGPEGVEMLDLMVGRVKRMNNLIEGVLQYSRVGRVRDRKQIIKLNELVEEVKATISPPPHISITHDDLPEIIFERVPLQQIVQNLISNAVTSIDKANGKINVGCSDLGKFYEISVSDNGSGIEERHFEKIFQIFQTLHPRDEMESTGIGLTIVKKTVEYYGGQIRVESKPGEGSTFYFTIPKFVSPLLE